MTSSYTKKEWQKGQDLWSHLASNSFTFCSLQFNIRGPWRAKGPGTGARGRMSRLTLNPPVKPASLCGTLRPSLENKAEGLTLARQPLVPGWIPSLLPFKAALQDHVQALALLRTFKPITHGAVLWACRDVTWQKGLPSQYRTQEYSKMETQLRVSPCLDSSLTQPNP